MKDLTHPGWIKFKGLLFLVLGLVAATLLLLRQPDWPTAVLLGLAIWAFCRAYYFAFYVVERYVDPRFRFSGLLSVLRWLCQRRR
jgi:hypothetical protein